MQFLEYFWWHFLISIMSAGSGRLYTIWLCSLLFFLSTGYHFFFLEVNSHNSQMGTRSYLYCHINLNPRHSCSFVTTKAWSALQKKLLQVFWVNRSHLGHRGHIYMRYYIAIATSYCSLLWQCSVTRHKPWQRRYCTVLRC